MAFELLDKSLLAPYADALLATQNGATAKYALPLELLGIMTDRLNESNPLLAYSSGIPVASTGVGSVELKWVDGDNAWVDKTGYGEDAFSDVDIERETVYWNKPVKRAEAMLAYDLAKGTPDVLQTRANRDLVKFTQDSIKNGFQKIFGLAGWNATAFTGTATGVQEKGAELLLALTQAATKMIVANEFDKGDVTITISALRFDELAFAGLIGNRVDTTFAGGQYSVGTAGGYRIQSGDMFIPTEIETPVAGKSVVTDYSAPLVAPVEAVALIGTSKVIVHNQDVISANAGTIGLTSDRGTYMEVADIAQVPNHAQVKGYAELVYVA